MINGMDISQYQGAIDFEKVKQDGIEFVMIRASIGSYTKDTLFEQNYAGATAAGLHWGPYHYFYSTTVAEAVAEADFFLSQIKGKKPTYPVMLDLEEPSLLSAGKEAITDAAVAFLTRVQSKGYYVITYANLNWLTNYLDFQKLRPFDVWLAQWGPTITFQEAPVGMWQYTSSGSVAGVNGRVDLDRAFKDYPSLIKNAGLNEWGVSVVSPTISVGDRVKVVGKIYRSSAGGMGYNSYFPSLYVTEILSRGAKPYRMSNAPSGATSGFCALSDLKKL